MNEHLAWLHGKLLFWEERSFSTQWNISPGWLARERAYGQTDDPLEEAYDISAYAVDRIASLTLQGLLDYLESETIN